MSDAVIAALITGSVSFIGMLISNWFANARRKSDQDDFAASLYSRLDKQSELSDARLDAKIEKLQAVTDTKLDALTREVREHNNFAMRIPVMDERISNLEKKIAEVEHK